MRASNTFQGCLKYRTIPQGGRAPRPIIRRSISTEKKILKPMSSPIKNQGGEDREVNSEREDEDCAWCQHRRRPHNFEYNMHGTRHSADRYAQASHPSSATIYQVQPFTTVHATDLSTIRAHSDPRGHPARDPATPARCSCRR